MIKQTLNIDTYWKVIVYYNVDYNLFDYIYKDLKSIDIKNRIIDNIYYLMSNRYAKGVTISNIHYKTSIVLLNTHFNKYDYLDTIVHEAEHVKQSMLKGYNIADRGEPPAYTIGYLVKKMIQFYNVLK